MAFVNNIKQFKQFLKDNIGIKYSCQIEQGLFKGAPVEMELEKAQTTCFKGKVLSPKHPSYGCTSRASYPTCGRVKFINNKVQYLDDKGFVLKTYKFDIAHAK